jgi:hypothetical protein
VPAIEAENVCAMQKWPAIISRIERKQNRAVKAMPHHQNLRQLQKRYTGFPGRHISPARTIK